MVMSENCRIFEVIKYKDRRTTVALITESKVIQLFCITDNLSMPIFQFNRFFDVIAGLNFTNLIVNCRGENKKMF